MYKSEKFWDRMVRNFDKQSSKAEEEYSVATSRIKKHLGVDDVVLDFGCATGRISNALAANVKRISGIDISSKMIEAAKLNAARNNVENANFIQATVFDLVYKEAFFDAIIAFSILHLVEDLPQTAQRLYELLKPGGIIISSTACLGENRTLFAAVFTFLSKLRLIPSINSFSISQLEDSIESANFQILETEKNFQGKFSYFLLAKKPG